MIENIRKIFDMNIKLISLMDKAVMHFRGSEYDKALSIVVESMENIHIITDAIIKDRDYFNLVSTNSVVEMLAGIVDAQKNRDYVLLADLIELQIIMFLCNVQELIMNKEDFYIFNQDTYENTIELILNRVINYEDTNEIIRQSLNPEQLLNKGYRIEFTSCGQMTLAATDPQDFSYYIHSNYIITGEAYSTALRWYDKNIKRYIIFGFGMGYVIDEFLKLIDDKDSTATVYEPDINTLKLSCGFSGLEDLFNNTKLNIVYDPDYIYIRKEIDDDPDAKVCIFYPSLRHVCDKEAKEFLSQYLPWADAV